MSSQRIRILFIVLLFLGTKFLEAQYDSLQIMALLKENLDKLHLTTEDLAEVRITDQYITESLGMTHIYLLQQYQGLDIHNAQLSIHIVKGKVVKTNSRMISLSDIQTSHKPALTPFQGLQFVANDLGENLETLQRAAVSRKTVRPGIEYEFYNIPISRDDVGVELKWLAEDNESIKLAWCVNIYEKDGSDYWSVFVDAHKGTILKKDNLVLHCAFDRHQVGPRVKFDRSPQLLADPVPVPSSASYNVFPSPIESPNHAVRMVMNNPWELAGLGNDAISLGWHNDGSEEYKLTRGNNVHAYSDHLNNSDTTGNAAYSQTYNFDFPYDPSLHPHDIKEAAVTNLFYWNNIIHDITYQYGFDEEAGNFQTDNMSRGGLGGDYVLAEAQDGGGLDNANFTTLPDGLKPLMQMYLWSPAALGSHIEFNAPAAFISKAVHSVESVFSNNNKITNVGLVTADIVLVNDLMEGSHQACPDNLISNGALVNGKIALIDRGDCMFVEKVKYVQDLGALAALIANNVTGDPISMGGTDHTIIIPAFMISRTEGDMIKAALLEDQVNITLSDPGTTIPDGDFDNGIITHEYAHGISIRLTGGPGNIFCLNNDEQMGEGWSDFFGLMLTTDWENADPGDLRGMGTYSIGASTAGTGIRTYPYTTDMSINPFTYGDVGGSSVHFIGSIWATMLWDMVWEIIAEEGVDPDIYHGNGGNNIAMQLVMDGLKLQPCFPGFVDGRDAILEADQIRYGGNHQCAIWRAFARRGLGASASQGSPADAEDGVEAFDIPTNEIFVDSTAIAGGSGNSWADAYSDLAPVLDTAGCHSIINVAKGTYYPTQGGDPNISFRMNDHTILTGGYPNGTTLVKASVPDSYPTHLSGDIGIMGNSSDNSYHTFQVLSGQRGIEVDGVIIGNSRPDPTQMNGYGPLHADGEIILRKTEVRKND